MSTPLPVRGLAAALCLALAGPVPAAETPSADSGPQRPEYAFLRQREDWSPLREAAELRGWDRIKYLSLSDDGRVWASVGGSARLRLEAWDHFGLLRGSRAEDEFLLFQARLHGDLHLGEAVRVFVEGKSALSTDRSLPGGRRTSDVDTAALQQAFVDLRIPLGDEASFTIRPGRQMFDYGAQRLVSPLPWGNTLRAWDAVSGIVRFGDWQLDGWGSVVVPVDRYDFNEWDTDLEFHGVYASGPIGGGAALDLYFLAFERDRPVTLNGTTGPSERYTLGARLAGVLAEGAVGYDLEAAWQFGEVGSGDVSAWMLGTQWSWTLGLPLAPVLSAGFEAGSGDSGAGGGVQTFDQLFPLGHAYLGFADLFARQNILAPNVGLKLKPVGKLALAVSFLAFWRESTRDGAYAVSGALFRAPGGSGASELGQEIDVTAAYPIGRHLHLLAGYSHFFPGRFFRDTGPASEIDFGYAQATYTF